MNAGQTIQMYQPTLQAIAYNLLRSKADAEDIVQETFVKWLSIDRSRVENTKAYLVKAVTNNCLNHLQALKKKKEEYIDSINVKELVNRFKETNFAHLDIEVELMRAFRLMHAKLEPLERAVYVLKEVFDFDYDALQLAVDKKKEHCRQLLCRAKKKLSEETAKVHFDLPDASKLLSSFKKACERGHVADLVQELKKDISVPAGRKS